MKKQPKIQKPVAPKAKKIVFSFEHFSRSHKLFNLGAITESWYINLIDCLKSVSGMTVTEARRSIHDLHPIDWEHANATPPDNQHEYWQFRINKSKGRIIGFLVDDIFSIVWLDPYHNLTNSEGYGKAVYYEPGLSDYELLEREFQILQQENESLKAEIKELKEIIES